MSDCVRAKRIVRRWVQGRTISEDELAVLQSHAPSCAECSRSVLPALPFIRRDVQGGPAVVLREPPADFTDAVMGEVARERPWVLWRLRRAPRWAALAAAAALLLFVGIGFLAFRVGAGKGSPEVVVHFELVAPDARSVALVGSFTQWQTSRIEMADPNRDGVWEASIRLRKGTVYAYNFVVDGTLWIADPNAPAQVDDGFGGQSSLLEL